jgi:hypothetical protein
MSDFREQSPANRGRPTYETDPVADLFSARYVFGESTYPIEQNPGPADGFGSSSAAPSTLREDPTDLTLPASQDPTPAAMGGPNTGADEKWYSWPSGQGTLVVNIPSGKDVRSLWFPQVRFAIAISAGQAPGNTMYAIGTAGAELVPVPAGTQVVALTTAQTSKWAGVWVLASAITWQPSKAATDAFLGAASTYDQVIIGTPTLTHYWPLNDPAGTSLCADYGPTPIPMQALAGVSLGAGGFLSDDATCAASSGIAGAGLGPQSPVALGQVCSVEFWVYPTNNPCQLFSVPTHSNDGEECCLAIDGNGLMVLEFAFSTYNTQTVVAPNATHYFVITSGGSTVDVYLDGSLAFTVSEGFGLGADFGLMFNAENNGEQATGKIAKVATYSGTLILSQIQQHFAAGLASA